MRQGDGEEDTLPSVAAALRPGYERASLIATLAYHPDPGRIGETAVLPLSRARGWLLGRTQPLFTAQAEESAPAAGRPLEDRRVSRTALRGGAAAEGVTLQRPAGSSRCRVDGQEIAGEAFLSAGMLRRGVALTMANRIVLLLREGCVAAGPRATAPALVRLRGSSSYMCNLRRQIQEAARHDLDILIRGETGTGKELVARAIHELSARAAQPLVAVNMAAIPASLAPAELFGSTRGAFTGAERKTGYFAQAAGGTLFLDEIGDTPAEVQPQLLRAIQEREIQQVGGQVRHIDLRILSATDVPLEQDDSGFRAALRHRLGGHAAGAPRGHRRAVVVFPAWRLRRTGAVGAASGRGQRAVGRCPLCGTVPALPVAALAGEYPGTGEFCAPGGIGQR